MTVARRSWMLVSVLVSGICVSSIAAEKLNLVIVIADDLGVLDCQPYGAKDVRTPNMQRLASEGLLFKQGDVESLVRCLDRLASAEMRAALGCRGRARVMAERNWIANARAVLKAVADIAAPHEIRAS